MRFDSKVAKTLAALGVSASVLISGSFLVAPSEGKVNGVYLDPVNILTSCYGHTGNELRIGQKYSDEQCYAQLAKDLERAKTGVNRVIGVPLNQFQEAALISFVYNAGEGKLAKSTMAKKFNSKDYVGGCEQLLRWVYAGKTKLKGLVVRREEEMKVCLGERSTQEFVEQKLREAGL